MMPGLVVRMSLPLSLPQPVRQRVHCDGCHLPMGKTPDGGFYCRLCDRYKRS